MSAAHTINKHYAKQLLGIDIKTAFPQNVDDQELYVTTVLQCAAADGVLSHAEKAVVMGTAAGFGNALSVLSKVDDLRNKFSLDDVLSRLEKSQTMKSLRRVIVYHCLVACTADEELADTEREAIKAVAFKMGLTGDDVKELLVLTHEQKAIKEDIFKHCWTNADMSTWKFVSNASNLLSFPIKTPDDLVYHAIRFYALYTCGIDYEQSIPLTDDEKERYAAILYLTAGADELDPQEEAYILGYLASLGISDDAMLSRMNEIKTKWTLPELVSSIETDPKLKDQERMILFQAISASYADGVLSADETQSIKRVAKAFNVDDVEVDKLIALYENQSDVRDRIIKAIWKESGPADQYAQ